MTVASKPVPTFKPNWLRKERKKRRRQPKGRRAKSGQWWKRNPRPVLWGSAVGRCIEATIGGWDKP